MERLLGEMILAVKEASEAVMKVYQRKFEIKIKDDASPVTEAGLSGARTLGKTTRHLSAWFWKMTVADSKRTGQFQRISETSTLSDR